MPAVYECVSSVEQNGDWWWQNDDEDDDDDELTCVTRNDREWISANVGSKHRPDANRYEHYTVSNKYVN